MGIAPGTVLDNVVVRSDQYGRWAVVPNTDEELWVSCTGWTWQFDVHSKSWYPPTKNAPKPVKGDVMVSHRGKNSRVHVLMATTFFGPRPTAEHTVDHIQKHGGDLVKERSDNRIENLRWATKRDQSLNRNQQVARRDGRNVLVWKVGSDPSTAVTYNSSLAAAKALGVNAGSLSRAANINGERTTGSKKKNVGGWEVLFADTKEPMKIAADEVFREYDGFFVSQYGRALDPQTKAWAFTPKPSKGHDYAHISRSFSGKTESRPFHAVVVMAWPDVVGHRPPFGKFTVDHRNRNKSDNAAANLRWADDSTQNKNKVVRKTVRRQARAVQLLPPGATTWLDFDNLLAASIKVPLGTIATSLRKKAAGRTISKGKYVGWTIRERL